MKKIHDTSLRISCDDVLNQTIRITSRNWGRDSRTIIFNELDDSVQNHLLDILQAGEYIELSRKEIFDTKDIYSKIIKILMWGYPRGTTNQAVGNNNGIHIILTRLNDCCSHLTEIKNRDFESSDEFLQDIHISFLINLRGVGVSTLSKLLYFFNVKIQGKQCIIYDSRVDRALSNFEETRSLNLRQSRLNDYPIFIEKIGEISGELNTFSDVIEYILFIS